MKYDKIPPNLNKKPPDSPANIPPVTEVLDPLISELVGDAAQMMNKDEEQFIQGMTAYGNIFETFPDLHQTIFRHSTQALQSLKKALDNPNINRQTQIKIHVLLTKISQYYQTFA